MEINPYGLLLAFDGYDADPASTGSEQILEEVLRTLPTKIGMRVLGTPHIVRITEAGIAGLSGFTFIMESHISIHTYEERGFVTADIYSCKQFDTKIVIECLTNAFAIASYETQQLTRGIRFNTPPPSSRPRGRP